MDVSGDAVVVSTVVLSTFLLAGFVKGVIGLGLPTVAVGLLSVIMAPAQAAALLIAPSLITNVWQMAAGGSLLAVSRRLWSMMLGICAGTYASAGLLTGHSKGGATTALGVALVLYAITGLSALRLTVSSRFEAWLSPLMGAATGFVTGATGVFVVPAVPYLQALGLEKDELVQALGLSFTISTVALGLTLASGGALTASLAGASLLALAPALGGMALGQYVRTRISAAAFRRWFFWGLFGLGGHLVLQTMF